MNKKEIFMFSAFFLILLIIPISLSFNDVLVDFESSQYDKLNGTNCRDLMGENNAINRNYDIGETNYSYRICYNSSLCYDSYFYRDDTGFAGDGKYLYFKPDSWNILNNSNVMSIETSSCPDQQIHNRLYFDNNKIKFSENSLINLTIVANARAVSENFKYTIGLVILARDTDECIDAFINGADSGATRMESNIEQICGVGYDIHTFTKDRDSNKTYNVNEFPIGDYYDGNYTKYDPVSLIFIYSDDDSGVNCGATTYNFIRIDDIGFYDINFTENELPTFNATIDDDTCFNESSEGITQYLNLSINVSDPENDTIYYSLNKYNGTLTFIFNEETFYDNNINEVDLNFFTSDNVILNSSDIYPETYSENIEALSQFSYGAIVYDFALGAVLGNTKLLISKYASEFYYRADQPLYNSTFVNYQLGLPYDDQNTNIVYYDSSLNEIFELTFNTTSDDRLLIYVNNTLTYNDTYSNYHEDGNGENDLIITTSFNFKGERIGLSIDKGGTGEILLYSFNTSYENFQYIGFDTSNKNQYVKSDNVPTITLDELNIKGYNFKISYDWTTTKPTHIPITSSGNGEFQLLVSDEFHYPDKYRTGFVYYLVPKCEIYIEGIELDQGDDLLGDFVNRNNLKGIPLLFAKFLWFIQFPYRIAVYFDILTAFHLVGILAVVGTTLSGMFAAENNKALSGAIIGFGVSIITGITKLIPTWFFLLTLFLGSLVIILESKNE